MAFYVLARVMIPGKHQHWTCVGKHTEYVAADRQSGIWYSKPAHEAQIVDESALRIDVRERFDAQLRDRAERTAARAS